MSGKKTNGHGHEPRNTDNQNTNTIYIPPQVHQQPYNGNPYPQQGGQRPYSGNPYPQQGGQRPHNGTPYPQQGGQRPYNGNPYPQQGGQRPYNGNPYPQQGGQRPHNGNPYPQQGGQRPHNGNPYPRQGGQRPPSGTRRRDDGRRQLNRPAAPPPQQKRKKRRSPLGKVIRRIILSLLGLFILLFGIYSCTAFSLIKKMNYTETGYRNRTSGAMSESYVTSVLLIGTDGRSLDEQGRSDTMILLSLNSRTNEISLTSFMRDCYVDIPGYGWDKLNAAYSYGGPELLMDTIESNFNVKIDDYVSVNFISFASVVDAVGGIDLTISDAEANEINTILQAEVNNIMGDDTFADLLSGGGNVHLNGKQALSYARIRYVGNADFERTERQRQVISLVIDKAKSFRPSILNNIAHSVLPQLNTNMASDELYLLSLRAPFALRYDLKQLQIPADGTFTYNDYTPSGSVLQVEFGTNTDIIRREVFSAE